MNKRIEELTNELANLCDEENVALVLSARDEKDHVVSVVGSAPEIGNCLLDLDLTIEKRTDLKASIMRMIAIKNRSQQADLGDFLESIFETPTDDCDCPGCKARREESDDENIDFSELTDAVVDLFKNIFSDKEGE